MYKVESKEKKDLKFCAMKHEIKQSRSLNSCRHAFLAGTWGSINLEIPFCGVLQLAAAYNSNKCRLHQDITDIHRAPLKNRTPTYVEVGVRGGIILLYSDPLLTEILKEVRLRL